MLKYFGLSEMPHFNPYEICKKLITKDIGLLQVLQIIRLSDGQLKIQSFDKFLKIDDQLCSKYMAQLR